MKGNIIAALSLSMMLAGCSSSNNGPGGMHKVDWYKAHHATMKKEETWCNNDVPRQKLAACLNAYEADMNTAKSASSHFKVGSASVGHGWTP
jgi:hypothetical protein